MTEDRMRRLWSEELTLPRQLQRRILSVPSSIVSALLIQPHVIVIRRYREQKGSSASLSLSSFQIPESVVKSK